MRILLAFLVFLGLQPNALFAQNTDSLPKLSLAEALRQGTVNFQSRLYFSNTNNLNRLPDPYALGLGLRLSYETQEWNGFSAGVGGFFAFNLASSNLVKPDSLTGQGNRYEAGLFDVTNLGARWDMNRLEMLYLQYKLHKTSLLVGKTKLNTPFLMPQDTRLNSSLQEGVVLNCQEVRNWTFTAAWLWRMSPRSTMRWYSAGESIGLYSVGVDTAGKKSAYAGNTKTAGVGMLGILYQPKKYWNIQVWDFLIENISNTAFIQAEFRNPIGSSNTLMVGLQALRQDAIGNGGNANPALSYLNKGSFSWLGSSRLGFENKNWLLNLNYTFLYSNTRFLMPREWGRDPFYTFLSRERNEGFGRVQAVVAQAQYRLNKINWTNLLAIGYYKLPHPTDFVHNKYGQPSYWQVNFSSKYSFGKKWAGLDITLLLVNKLQASSETLNWKYIYNRVNMSQINLIINYNFASAFLKPKK